MVVKDVSEFHYPAKGFLQAYKIVNNEIITLNKIEKNLEIGSHKHPHQEFGYFFKGESNFIINDKKYNLKANQSYLINGLNEHSWHVLGSHYSFYYNFFGEPGFDNIKKDIFTNRHACMNYSIETAEFGRTTITKIRIKKANTIVDWVHIQSKSFYLIASENCHFELNNHEALIEPMKIYNISMETSDNTLFIKNSCELLIIKTEPTNLDN